MKGLIAKADTTHVNTEREAYALQGSFVADGNEYTDEQLKVMAQNWIHVEDDPNIIDAEIDEELEDLEKAELMEGRDADDEDDAGESNVLMVVDDTDAPPAAISFLEAEQYLQALQQYSRSIKLPAKEAALLDRYGRSLRAYRLSLPKSSPTLLSFFAPVYRMPVSGESQHVPNALNDSARSISPLRGLRNLGHTCYQNAVLQMLFSCFDFMNALNATTCRCGIPVTTSICLTNSVLESRVSSLPISPQSVKDAIDGTTKLFAERREHDAHEFFTQLLDCIHDELKGAPEVNDGPVPTDYFSTIIKQHLMCKRCGFER
jgi:hypothetical protein